MYCVYINGKYIYTIHAYNVLIYYFIYLYYIYYIHYADVKVWRRKKVRLYYYYDYIIIAVILCLFLPSSRHLTDTHDDTSSLETGVLSPALTGVWASLSYQPRLPDHKSPRTWELSPSYNITIPRYILT